MEMVLSALICISVLAVTALTVKILFMRRAAREIAAAFSDRMSTDTNTLIDISSRDGCMRDLVATINTELAHLRRERCRYRRNDTELMTAVTNIAHDLRTPLTATRGYLDLLEREPVSDAAARYISRIRNRTEALQELTNELFGYSMIASSPALDIKQVDLVCALEGNLLAFYAAMSERGLNPKISLIQGPIYRMLDTEALGRIFSNIIGNALKYSDGDFAVVMDENGKIGFENTASSLDAVTVGRLFDRFYTVESARGSTGLGLSIAKTLAERMGGKIGAEYTNGKLKINLEFPPEQ